VYVWGLLRFGFTPEVNAVFTLIGGFSLLLIGGALIMLLATARRREKQLAGIGTT
jgi:spermidine/putrescine transport system permease protein